MKKQTLKNKLFNLAFMTSTILTKCMLAMAALLLVSLEIIVNHKFTWFMSAVLAYGIGMLYRVLYTKQRVVQTCILSVAGAFFWTYEAWATILAPSQEISSIVSSVIFSLASLWILTRTGTHDVDAQHECSYKKICPFQEER